MIKDDANKLIELADAISNSQEMKNLKAFANEHKNEMCDCLTNPSAERALDNIIQDVAEIYDLLNGTTSPKKKLLYKIRKVLGYTYP